MTGESVIEFLNAHEAKIRQLAWSPDGESLASCGDDKLIRIWDFQRKILRQALEGHSSDVVENLWCDNDCLATCSRDHTVMIWDLNVEAPRQVIRAAQAVSCMGLQRDARRLLVGDEKGGLYSTSLSDSEPRLKEVHSADHRLVRIQCSDKWNLVVVAAGNSIHVFRDDLSLHQERVLKFKVRDIACNQDSLLVCGENSQLLSLKLPDLTTEFTLDSLSQSNLSVAQSDDGLHLAAYGNDRKLTCWQSNRLSQPSEIAVALTQARIKGVAFHPKLPLLASIGPNQRSIQIWRLAGDEIEASQQNAYQANAVWQERLNYLLAQEAIITDPAQKFSVTKQIEECRKRIAEIISNQN